MPRIVATATGYPPHYYEQRSISMSLQEIWSRAGVNPARVARLHAATSVEGRYIAVPKEEYYDMHGWAAPNAVYADLAVRVGEETLTRLFSIAGLAPEDIALFTFASTTGLAVPTIDARLMNRLPFRSETKRLPLFGLGCVAGAAGTARVADYLRGHPDEVAVLLCAEFCSLTIQKHDVSVANIIACGLFGDAVGAVLMVGDDHPLAGVDGPAVVGSRSVFFPETEQFMGWDIAETGMQIVLSADLPETIESALRGPLESFLTEHDLSLADIGNWVCHPGGPKVLDSVERALQLNGTTLQPSRDVLREIGNVSSVSVLVLLDRLMHGDRPASGTHGMMMAMGPGFVAEFVLLRW